jgi:uncharacterized protein
MVKWSLINRDRTFQVLFEQSTQNAVKMAQQLKDLIDIWDNVRERVGIISDLEHQGDAITHQIFTRLYRVLIPPFDQEDITLLANSLDDVCDFIHSTADFMLLYGVQSPTEDIKKLADILIQSIVEVERAVSDIFSHIEQSQILKRCVLINHLENLGDAVYRSALANLMKNMPDDFYLIKWREIYKHIETAIDRCEDVANVIEGIAYKYS